MSSIVLASKNAGKIRGEIRLEKDCKTYHVFVTLYGRKIYDNYFSTMESAKKAMVRNIRKAAGSDGSTPVFVDIESGDVVTKNQLFSEYSAFQAEDPEEYSFTFEEYIKNCLTSNNGTLEKI